MKHGRGILIELDGEMLCDVCIRKMFRTYKLKIEQLKKELEILKNE